MNNAILKKAVLFRGMSEAEVADALQALSAREEHFQKGEIILHAGETTACMGLVLRGSATIENTDMWGNRTILSSVGAGQFFAETYAMLTDEPMMVDVVAREGCSVLFLRIGGLHELSRLQAPWILKLLGSLLTISASKNLLLSNRSFHTAPKTIRGRVMAYLNSVSLRRHSREFDIPFDRQQLADYLNLERSALSKELGKMQREELIAVKKNHFIILSDTE